MSDYPPVDETLAHESRRKFYNHPVAVVSCIVDEEFRRMGKKMLPPEDLRVVKQYMQENRTYFEQRDRKFWQSLRDAMAQPQQAMMQKNGRI